MTIPLVSVLMAVYNGARFLPEAINSILAQTYTDFEFLIVDDGSTDETAEILRSYDDPRIRVLTNSRNMGLAASLNRGWREARGDLLARQDADDLSEPQRLATQVRFMQAHPKVALLGSSCIEIDVDGNMLEEVHLATDSLELQWQLLYCCPFYHTAIMLRRTDVQHRIGVFDESLRYSMDYQLWQRIAASLPVASIDELLVRYRHHEQSMSSSYGEESYEGYRMRLAKVRDLLGWSELTMADSAARFDRMCRLLLNHLHQLQPAEAAAAMDDVLRLHTGFGRQCGINQGQWQQHHESLRAQLLSRVSTARNDMIHSSGNY